jgi:hypothetical protein
MDKERILQTVLTLAVIGSLALVAGAIVTGDSDWDSTQVASWRDAPQRRANPPAEVAPPAPDVPVQQESASPPTAP